MWTLSSSVRESGFFSNGLKLGESGAAPGIDAVGGVRYREASARGDAGEGQGETPLGRHAPGRAKIARLLGMGEWA